MRLVVFLSALCLSLSPMAQPTLAEASHGEVHFEAGRFGGWPANGGIWHWDNEIVTMFILGYFDPEKKDGHPIDNSKPSSFMQARSLDGGETWALEMPSFLQETHQPPEGPLTKPMDFTAPGFAMMLTGGRYYFTTDRCVTWQGPYELPSFDRPGLLARTDYIVNGPTDLLAFLATQKDDGEEGWPAAIRTRDGGQTWTLEGWIGTQPDAGEYAIMPSTARLGDGSLFSWIRNRRVAQGEKKWFIDAYLSTNDGRSWYHLADTLIDNGGNPPSMIRLADGRLAVTYGHRQKPDYGIRARISADEGVHWGEEFVIRGDGGGWDLGYPRTIQRPDGKCLTVYYFMDGQRPERYIAYSLWTPPAK